MLKHIIFIFTLCFVSIKIVISAEDDSSIDPIRYQEAFESAYTAYPIIPDGMLEAVAYAQTRINHISGNNQGCSGIPQVKGVMGLTEDGKGYFNNNLAYVSRISGISIHAIKSNPADNIMAYAAAYDKWMREKGIGSEDFIGHDEILKTLSEIPWDKNDASDFALSCFTYEVFNFLNNPVYQSLFDLPERDIDLTNIYGEDNYSVLTSRRVIIDKEAVYDEDEGRYRKMDRSAEYGPAIWNEAPTCNYTTGRGGTAISAVTVHTIQGSYAGAISWAHNCLSNVSYHYVARSSDGQITQMVLEENKAWHVGSANPYTIGIEHEGYVDDPVWYTEAMYIASADLVRDITDSGYGINPLRTYQGPATVGTLTLGSCTKIKGHQHFPGASHTDPGVNWDWEHYYQLINDDPEITLYTAASGTHYDSGGAAEEYENDERFLYLIQPDDASSITLNIVSFNVEEDWDYLYIYDGEDLDAPLIEQYTGTDIPDVITSSGGSVLLEFRSDCGITEPGWEIDWTAIIGDGDGDEAPPHTEVVLDEDWYTEDFLAEFTDLDDTAGSGVNYQFYQVIDYNGTEWRANNSRGFFSDNFDDAIHVDWTTVTGTWFIALETLEQNDEVPTNTNIYADLNQDDYDQFLFHWSGKIRGLGSDKRAGFHFMCDDPTLVNRGNSYFVWFREDDNKVQIYKVLDDVFTLGGEIDYPFSAGTWYDFKTVYDKETGGIHVWVNNAHIISWVDDSPLTNGNSVSFRSGNSRFNVNNFKAYHNRTEEATIAVGPTGDARYQNADPYTPAAKVKSIVVDSAYNVSVIGAQLVDIDWTPPLPIGYLNDGEGADIETTTTNTELQANWAVTTDPNSGLAGYWYAIGDTPGDSNIVGWTDNWFADTIRHTGLSLVLGETYYFSVAAKNGAGLYSDTIISNGQMLVEPTEPPVASFIADHTNLCGLDSIKLENGSTDALTYAWSMPGGTPSTSVEVNPYVSYLIAGTYEVRLIATGPGGEDTTYQTLEVELNDPPIAAFTPSSAVVFLADPLVTFENESANADGYYWDFGDDNYSADDSPWHNYSAAGDYTVELIAVNGDCPNDTITENVLVLAVDGIQENDFPQLSIFPNPADEFIQIHGIEDDAKGSQYEIYDAKGSIVISGNLNVLNENNRIDIGMLAEGSYYITLSINNSLVTRSFIVK